jgi:hypothetical protein
MFCRSLFVLLSLNFGHCVVFHLWILITPLVSSNSFLKFWHIGVFVFEKIERTYYRCTFLFYFVLDFFFTYIPIREPLSSWFQLTQNLPYKLVMPWIQLLGFYLLWWCFLNGDCKPKNTTDISLFQNCVMH